MKEVDSIESSGDNVETSLHSHKGVINYMKKKIKFSYMENGCRFTSYLIDRAPCKVTN